MRVNIFTVHESLLSNLSFLVDLVLKYHCMKWQLKEKKAYLSTLQKIKFSKPFVVEKLKNM